MDIFGIFCSSELTLSEFAHNYPTVPLCGGGKKLLPLFLSLSPPLVLVKDYLIQIQNISKYSLGQLFYWNTKGAVGAELKPSTVTFFNRVDIF